MRRRRAAGTGFALTFLAAVILAAGSAAAAWRWLPRDSELHFALTNLVGSPLDATALGDGGPADSVVFGDPVGLALGPDAALYVADRGRNAIGHVVWRITADGRATIVAGTGRKGRPMIGQSALASHLASPENLAFDASGRMLIVDSLNHMVLAVERDGTVQRVAGTGAAGDAGDGGPAEGAELDHPYDIEVGPDGRIFIADFGNNRIRVIDRDGTIDTLAGSGIAGYAGDGGPAVQARLDGPYGVLPLGDGSVLIADSGNHVIRRVTSDGRIVTYAGTGEAGFEGDGGLALDARFDSPQSLSPGPDGGLYVNDEHNKVIRAIDRHGIVSTLAGSGGAAFNDPENVLMLPDGSLAIAVGDDRTVIRIVPGEPVARLAGLGAVGGGAP